MRTNREIRRRRFRDGIGGKDLDQIIQWAHGVNDAVNGFVWGPFMICLLTGVGIYLTVRLGFLQIFRFRYIFKNTIGKSFAKSAGAGNITSSQAGMASICAVLGNGNIAGVATAIAIGGPGAMFWMWVAAFFGMATKFAEITLGVYFREKRPDGTYAGGAMYYIEKGLHQKWLAVLFSIMVIAAYFIMGAVVNTNTICLAVETNLGVRPVVTGALMAVLTGIVILGGLKRIGEVCEYLTPIMADIYIAAGIAIVLFNVKEVPGAFAEMVRCAFTPVSAAGGFAGAGVMKIVSIGMSRGLFTNEAGMGSSPMIHSSAQVTHPVQQGMWGAVEVFLDTIVVATITGLAIVISGLWTSGITGAELTMRAFDLTLPGNIGSTIVMFSAFLFGYSCLVTSHCYCERAADYLFGAKSVIPVRILWLLFIVAGAGSGLDFIWSLADTANGVMAVPNLIALILLSPVVIRLTREYFGGVDKNRRAEKGGRRKRK